MNFDAGQRRLYKRHPVNWNALLTIETDDFSDYITVPVINVSTEGALIQSNGISIHHRHFAAASLDRELTLVIHTPEGEMDSEIRVMYFKWSEAKKQFDIGARFINISEKNLAIMRRAIEVAGSDTRETMPGTLYEMRSASKGDI